METIKSRLEKDLDNIIRLRESGIQIKEIAKMYDVHPSNVSSILLSHNVLWRRKLTKDDYPNIIQRYIDGEPIHTIAKDYRVTDNKISQLLKDNNIHIRDISECHRIYDLNESYFDFIDTPNKAYIIGLLIADGNISKNNSVRLQLVESDKSILEKIRKEIGSTRPLTFVNVSKRKSTYQDSYLLEFASRHMIDKLADYYITPRKDFTTQFPVSIDEHLYRHVIRGILDGDGSIFKNEKRVNITGNDKLIDFLVDYIQDTLDIHCSVFYAHHSDKTKCLQISGAKQVKKFLDYIYEDAELYIDRKYDIYQNLYCA